MKGALFKNDRKETEKHPDYRGEAEIDGIEFYVSAWLTKSKKGTTYMSLKFKPKSEAGAKGVKDARTAVQQPLVEETLNDDIPF